MNAQAPQSLPLWLTTPPHNIESEQALLGAILVNNEAMNFIPDTLKPEHFSEPLHQHVYAALAATIGSGRKATPVTMKTAFEDVDLGGLTISQYIARLAAEATTIINANDYACQIIDLWRRREIIKIAMATADTAAQPAYDLSVDGLLDELDNSVVGLRNALPDANADRSTLYVGAGDLLADIHSVKQGDAPEIPTSGFIDIDRTLGGGLRPGRLIVLAGRPGMGKTVLLCAMARRAARKGFGVDIYSLEIDRKELTARMMANSLGSTTFPLDYRDILTGRVESTDVPRLRELGDKFRELPLSIDATPSLKIGQIESRAKRTAMRLEKAGKKLRVVFIDYLGLIGASDRYKGRKVDEMGEMVLGAKNMAKRLDVCVVLLAQLNRSVEARDNKHPLMSDLRDSGNIEEHADAVGLLYRPAYYDAKDPRAQNGKDGDFLEIADARKNVLEVIFDKNRLGPTGTVKLYCNVARSFVDNMRM